MPLSSGTRLGSYEIMSVLGTGGMGAVYLARDTKLTRHVAIKVLHGEDTAGAEANRRLLREARAAARLDHPNICAIHEVGEADGRAFIVMQLVEGETLETRLRQGPIGVAEGVALGAEIADALGEAHAHGIVHRDVKPANIIVTRKGQAKVMDFGVAASMPDRAGTNETRTATAIADSAVVGSLPYMCRQSSLAADRSTAAATCSAWAGCSMRRSPVIGRSKAPAPLRLSRRSSPDRLAQRCVFAFRHRRLPAHSDPAVDIGAAHGRDPVCDRGLLRAPGRQRPDVRASAEAPRRAFVRAGCAQAKSVVRLGAHRSTLQRPAAPRRAAAMTSG